MDKSEPELELDQALRELQELKAHAELLSERPPVILLKATGISPKKLRTRNTNTTSNTTARARAG